MTHLRSNWKKYALALVAAGALYYGVDPEFAKGVARSAYEQLGGK